MGREPTLAQGWLADIAKVAFRADNRAYVQADFRHMHFEQALPIR